MIKIKKASLKRKVKSFKGISFDKEEIVNVNYFENVKFLKIFKNDEYILGVNKNDLKFLN